VPKRPGDAPITPMMRPPKTRGMSPGGRVSQSSAFLSAPGMLLLYSGLAISSAADDATLSLSSWARTGTPFAASRSPS
jgi:hypothetical protein